MNEELRAQMMEELLRLLREAISSGKVVVKAWPSLGSVNIDNLPEDAVKLLAALA